MTTFIESSNCRGRRPEGVVARRHYSRPDLIARLLRDRHAARFIVAPMGFGKSTVAFEYADIIFSFEHVFWLNGRSPCFLRDLDAGTLLYSIKKLDQSPALVVFDDVPHLDADRASAFAELIDALLEIDVEVIAACVPSADSFSRLRRNRVLLTGADLLLSDDELEAEAMSGRFAEDLLEGCSSVQRVACMRWAENNGAAILLQGLRHEELPGEVRLAMLAMLLLGQGSVDALASFIPHEHVREIVGIIGAGYALFGIDNRTATFQAEGFAVKDVAALFCAHLDELVGASCHSARETLCAALADALLARKAGERACSFVSRFAPKNEAASWVLSHGWQLLDALQALPLRFLLDEVKRGAAGMHEPLALLRGWVAFQLGDLSSATRCARRVLRADAQNVADRARAALLLLRAGDTEAHTAALGELAALVGLRSDPLRTREEVAPGVFDWRVAGSIALASAEGAAAGLAAWVHERQCASEKGDDAAAVCALMLGAAWVLEAFSASAADSDLRDSSEETTFQVGQPAPADADDMRGLETLVRYVGECLGDAVERGELGWYVALAGMALDRVVAKFPQIYPVGLEPHVAVELHRCELALLEQRDAYRRAQVNAEQSRREYRATHPDAFRRDEAASKPQALATRTSVPMLELTLFGGLKVRIGGELVDPHLLSRHKTRTLLVLLAINRGREVPRERLACALWPESEFEFARKNFYTVWSQLRRALAVEGSCPYLLRTQGGCQLDARLVVSDLQSFEELCRKLIFGAAEAGDWEHLYGLVCNEYADDFMPGEDDNPDIVSLRLRYRMQLVDALIAASRRLGDAGEVRGSLWFAREALRRDAKREDAYVALMHAQIASDQRGAALETYFAARRFLSEELGIDPSAHLVGLYRSIIETEESFT